MKKLVLSFFLLSANVFAHDLRLKYASDVKPQDKKLMEQVFSEVSLLLPEKMKAQLPKDIEIKVTKLSNHNVIPDEVCTATVLHVEENNETRKEFVRPFIYGQYDQYRNVLTINTPVLQELQKGKENSKRINCQHKSLYDQAIATIIHELTHAYDLGNGRISNSMEFIRRAGFKKGLLKINNKNVEAMRLADAYELVDIAESFAVNMEYFAMDPEFFCRRPSMFNYFKQLFNSDPYPTRTCVVNNTVMVSSATSGFTPTAIDPARVYRIDYLMASAGKGLESGFGHSMFRLVICAPERLDALTNRIIPATPFGKKCLEDRLFHLVVSYRANVEDARLSYIKGITGGYPSMLFILNLGDVLDEYNRDELRDILSYPLNLNAKEREDFILKVKEEHWNYRGSYKFFNNNCAVESYDLLKSALERTQLNNRSSYTPNGVLEDLDKLNFLSVKSDEIETYKAKSEQILLAYKLAYGFKPKNEKENKKSMQKFIDESSIESRMSQFKIFQKTELPEGDLNAEISSLKDRLVIASSFSVMEQQILRSKALRYRKEAAEMFMNNKDEKIKEFIKKMGETVAPSILNLSKGGYGIPFKDEMVDKEEQARRALNGAENMLQAEKFLRELMANEFSSLELMAKNIQVYNAYSLQIRKEFRTKLEIYIHQVLKNLSTDDYTRAILVSAAEGDNQSLKKVRELLGKDLVNEKEILDLKLRKFIQDAV